MDQLDAVVVMCASVSDKSKSTCILLARTHYPLRVNSEHSEHTSPHPTTQCTVLLCYQLKRVSRHGVKGTYTWYSASSWIITSEALRYGTCSQGISQFYLHTHMFIRNRNEPYLPLPSQLYLVLIYRPRRDGQAELAWVAGYVVRQFTCPNAVTHPTTNWAQCSATALIKTNALPLH